MKAAAIRKVTGEPRYMTALERARQNMPFRRAFIESLKRPFAMLVLEPIVQSMCIYLTVVVSAARVRSASRRDVFR
jgi:hypothetical protein